MKILILAIFLVISSFGDSIVKENSNIILNDKKIGTVYKGTELIKTGEELTATGWVMEGNEYILFYKNTDRIKLLRIGDEYTNQYKVLNKITDDYNVVWKNVTFTFKVDDIKNIVTSSSDVWKNEEELYQRCGSCHVARTPKEYKVNAWPNVVKTMADRAGFTKEETSSVGVYMQYRALKQSLEH